MVTVLAASAAAAGVTHKTHEKPYWVSGTTAKALVAYMRRHPTRGDRGAAWANIRPRYDLKVATRAAKGCAVKAVNLHIRFVVTLPRARQSEALKASTRRLWRSFTAFARAHENAHKRIYLNCARDFAAQARRTPAATSCAALKRQVRRQLDAAMRACDAKHLAFDRREAGRLKRHPLLRAAVK